ncbi:MAG: PGF-CTERM sorting domain-containing protein, partial [Methanosarcinaceae archaeon]|nr:PGF-CTERM sorting domain-containing protein [Methanosarcinaceae archaeon]
MKRFTAVSLAALMALTMILSVIPASAVTVNTVEVRGPVYNGTSLTAIFASEGLNDTSTAGVSDFYLEMNASNFAGFYYDIDDDISTEVFRIYNATSTGTTYISGSTGILEDGIEYTSTIDNVDYKSSNLAGTYPVLGLFAEKYVPIVATDVAKLSKLIVDDNTKYTLRTG